MGYEFVSHMKFGLKTELKRAHNTTMKYISDLKKIVNSNIRKGWLQKDPFLSFKMRKQEVERIAPTQGLEFGAARPEFSAFIINWFQACQKS